MGCPRKATEKVLAIFGQIQYTGLHQREISAFSSTQYFCAVE